MPSSTADAQRVVTWSRTVRFCERLNSEQFAAIASQIQVRPFAAGETLASAGDEVTEFWILAEGELDAFLTDARGRESPVGTIRQGETVGEVVILDKLPTRPVRFTARTNGTLLVAPAAVLFDWVETYPQLMRNLFYTLSARFKQAIGASSRNIPAPRLGILAPSPRGRVLVGRFVTGLLAAGERLSVWADRPENQIVTGTLRK